MLPEDAIRELVESCVTMTHTRDKGNLLWQLQRRTTLHRMLVIVADVAIMANGIVSNSMRLGGTLPALHLSFLHCRNRSGSSRRNHIGNHRRHGSIGSRRHHRGLRSHVYPWRRPVHRLGMRRLALGLPLLASPHHLGYHQKAVMSYDHCVVLVMELQAARCWSN